jgi:predicted CoA-binding protein
MKKTLILGASDNPDRFSYKAAGLLLKFGHPILCVSKKKARVYDYPILNELPESDALVDTVTLYLNPVNQTEWIEGILKLKPKRIIFNPGTENDDFRSLAESHGIHTEYACTLVMLNTGQF